MFSARVINEERQANFVHSKGVDVDQNVSKLGGGGKTRPCFLFFNCNVGTRTSIHVYTGNYFIIEHWTQY